jgi:hypothetical protein
MSIVEMKEKLHHYIETAKVEQVKAIYTILEDKLITPSERISIEQYNLELDEAEANIEAGSYYTQKQVKELIKK